MRKLFLLFLLSVLFTSCVWIPNRDYKSIRNKSTYETFTELSNPIIISTQLSARFEMKGNSKQKHSFLMGEIFSIYDFETDTVKDYTVIDSTHCYPKLQKYITSSGTYKFGLWNKYKNQSYFMAPDKTEVTVFDATEVSEYDQTDVMQDVYRYKLFYKNTYDTYSPDNVTKIKFYDADTDSFGNDIEIENYYGCHIHTPGYIPVSKGGDGYVWFFTQDYQLYPNRGKWYLNRINPETEKLDSKLASFDEVDGDEIHKTKSDCEWENILSYAVVDSIGDNLLIQRFHSFSNYSKTYYYDYLVVNKTTFDVTVIDCDISNYIGIAAGKYWFCDDYNVFVAYDVSTLEKITDTSEMTFNKDLVSFYIPYFYVQGDIIYAFALKELGTSEEHTELVYAFDAVNRKLIKMTELTESRLVMDE